MITSLCGHSLALENKSFVHAASAIPRTISIHSLVFISRGLCFLFLRFLVLYIQSSFFGNASWSCIFNALFRMLTWPSEFQVTSCIIQHLTLCATVYLCQFTMHFRLIIHYHVYHSLHTLNNLMHLFHTPNVVFQSSTGRTWLIPNLPTCSSTFLVLISSLQYVHLLADCQLLSVYDQHFFCFAVHFPSMVKNGPRVVDFRSLAFISRSLPDQSLRLIKTWAGFMSHFRYTMQIVHV